MDWEPTKILCWSIVASGDVTRDMAKASRHTNNQGVTTREITLMINIMGGGLSKKLISSILGNSKMVFLMEMGSSNIVMEKLLPANLLQGKRLRGNTSCRMEVTTKVSTKGGCLTAGESSGGSME